jgi:hypothetical protein
LASILPGRLQEAGPPRRFARTEAANANAPAQRGISEAVADRNGVVSSDTQLLFPFMRGGEVVTVKSRGIEEKKFALTKDSEKIPMGWDDAYGQPVVVVVEGEFDKLAIEEATGWEYVVSPPNGAKPSDQVFEYLVDICEHAERVLLAGDMDEPGRAFMQELSSRVRVRPLLPGGMAGEGCERHAAQARCPDGA